MRIFIALNVLILVLILLRKLMSGKISCKAQYCTWIIVPIFLLVSSVASIPLEIELQQTIPNSPRELISQISNDNLGIKPDAENMSMQMDPAENNTLAEDEITQDANAKTKTSAFDYKLALAIFWLSGSLIIGTSVLVHNLVFAKQIRKNRKWYSTSEYGNLNVYKIDGLDSPFLFGKSIYIPDSLDSDSINYTFSICHEYCHYRFGDCFWNVIRSLFVIALWFDPIVWVAYYLVQQDSELAVDERVIELLGEENRIKYGEMLIGYVANISGYSRLMSIATSINGKSKSFMKKRIIRISRKSHSRKYAAIPACIMLSIVCGGLLIKPSFVYADVKAPLENDETISSETVLNPNEYKSEITFDTDNLVNVTEFVIPGDITNNVIANCAVVNITNNRMYICIRGLDRSRNENIFYICCYEFSDGHQGDYLGSVDIEREINSGRTSCIKIMDVYENGGKVYATMTIWGGVDSKAAFYVYELNFENGSATYDRSVVIDDFQNGYIDVMKTSYYRNVLYVHGYLHDGSNQYAFYEITDEGFARIETDDRSKWTYSNILYPVFTIK